MNQHQFDWYSLECEKKTNKKKNANNMICENHFSIFVPNTMAVHPIVWSKGVAWPTCRHTFEPLLVYSYDDNMLIQEVLFL